LPPGPVDHCQICNSEALELIVDLGHQPLCDTLLTQAQLNQPEETFPLRWFRCKNCSLTQLDYVVPGEKVYHRAYPYRPGITKEIVEHFESFAESVVRKFTLPANSLVVDFGSNDGSLLKAFKKRGMRVVGVEPTDIAKIAIADGVDTVQSFFNENAAAEVVKRAGQASVLTATNVFAHMATLGQVMRAAETLLQDGGVFVIENHYLPPILQNVQYDTIYHEHIRSYSLKSLVHLFEMYEFTVVDCEVVERYSGSIRVAAMKGKGKVSDAVKKALAAEDASGIYGEKVYTEFREKTYRVKDQLLELALKAKADKRRFVGNSCPGRCSTLLNFTGISQDLMPYIAEQPTSLKLGLYLPGKHIPVVKNEILFREQPDDVVLLAWHLGKEIMADLRKRGLRSRFIMPLPEVTIISD
jgi:SAM-dependent methyltransferase